MEKYGIMTIRDCRAAWLLSLKGGSRLMYITLDELCSLMLVLIGIIGLFLMGKTK